MKSAFRFVSASFAMLLAAAVSVPARPPKSSPPPAPDGGFTLQQALSAPFPTDLTPSPSKAMFAWVFNAEGRRNVWIAAPDPATGKYRSRALTNYTEDDGQDIGELAWAPDSSSIVYTRGGDLEFLDKPYPNPARNPEGEEQDVWVVSLSGGEPRKIGEGHSAAVSPDGKTVAYILKDQIWSASLDGSGKPGQLVHARGNAGQLRWSPDGASLAFTSDRTDHGFIGLFTLHPASLAYLSPSTDLDTDAAWSPDGEQIAFLRQPSQRDLLPFGAMRAGPPWSIHVYDLRTQKASTIWTAREGQGSVFREMVAKNQLLWGAGNRIIFPWEADGWTHLYSISASGGQPILLTPGAFEVEDVSLTPDRKDVLYSSNQDDVDRRHIWRVSVSGGTPQEITSGTGIETYPVAAGDDSAIAILRSDARIPMRPALLSSSGAIRDLAADQIPSTFPAAQLVVPQQVIFPSADGLTLHGQLFLPPGDSSAKRYPAVVFFHGGSRRQMLLGWHYMDYYNYAYGMNQYLASRGFIVLAVNYRSGIGYGLDFREALNYGATGASEYNDVQGAGLFLRGRSDVDPHRIGAWGGSYGGYLTALALARSSDLYAAGVDMHGVHDWNIEITNWVASYDPRTHPDFARIAFDSSPIASVSTWRSPVLLVHGDDDRNVPFAETVELADALRKQGVEFQELIFPDEIHTFLLHRSWIAAYSAGADFLSRHLQSSESAAAAH
ncbi:MAG TPA: prolyl oligopeptidase family serine peptidase [Verrucomicrobiae bacterium]|nr:prolyl oligopeptidase family serine peptidase [Verrucomicrobiae bacterium]